VIPLIQCNVMYERYHFFGPPCIIWDVLYGTRSKNLPETCRDGTKIPAYPTKYIAIHAHALVFDTSRRPVLSGLKLKRQSNVIVYFVCLNFLSSVFADRK